MGQTRRFAIIGAGMAGLTAADELQRRGVQVTIFDKSLRAGGRIASRRTPAGLFDHGAPGIEAASPEFAAYLARLGGQRGADGCFRASPGIRSLFDPLLDRLTIRWRTMVASIERLGRDWFVLSENGVRHGPFEGVIVTTPAPQAARVIDGAAPAVSSRLRAVGMESIWTGLLAFDQPIRLPRQVRGGRSLPAGAGDDGTATAWVVHMGVGWSETHLETDAPFAAALLIDEIEAEAGERLPQTRFLAAHRWRFAHVRTPVGEPFLADPALGLWSGGDWALGRMAEHAWTSGRAMARAALETEEVAG